MQLGWPCFWYSPSSRPFQSCVSRRSKSSRGTIGDDSNIGRGGVRDESDFGRRHESVGTNYQMSYRWATGIKDQLSYASTGHRRSLRRRQKSRQDVSYFHYLLSFLATSKLTLLMVSIVKLIQNRRSHGSIIAFSNRFFYEDELRASARRETTTSLFGSPILQDLQFPLVFHGISGEGQQSGRSQLYFNNGEASLVKEYCLRLVKDPARHVGKLDIRLFCSPSAVP